MPMTPRERYRQDPEFHQLVKMMVAFIERAQFTPTELREAALLAAIMYQETHFIPQLIPEAEQAIDAFLKHRGGWKRK